MRPSAYVYYANADVTLEQDKDLHYLQRCAEMGFTANPRSNKMENRNFFLKMLVYFQTFVGKISKMENDFKSSIQYFSNPDFNTPSDAIY